MNLDDIVAQIAQIPKDLMKLQPILNRFLVVLWLWMSFFLAYKESYTESPTFPEMLLYIIRFFTRPLEYVIEKLFYT